MSKEQQAQKKATKQADVEMKDDAAKTPVEEEEDPEVKRRRVQREAFGVLVSGA